MHDGLRPYLARLRVGVGAAESLRKEEPFELEGRSEGGSGFGTGSADFPGGSGGDEMATWGDVGARREVRLWRALGMLAVALAIFGLACWLMYSRADRTAWWMAHACAGRCR